MAKGAMDDKKKSETDVCGSPPSGQPDPLVKKGERISKRMAHAGLCSRRDAERWITDGRVMLNGKKLKDPAVNVTDEDQIIVDGRPLSGRGATRLWRYNKPSGLVTTHKDEKGRRTVFDALPDELPRVISIGRLDLNTEGLLLLTNNGDLARHLEHPSTGWTRSDRVRAFGKLDLDALKGLRRGLNYKGVNYRSIDARLEDKKSTPKTDKATNHWLTVRLNEGKNREVRNAMEAIGLQVNRLIRTSYGPFQLGKLERGEVDEISRTAIKNAVGKDFL